MAEQKKSKKNLKFTTIAWILAVMLLIIFIPVNIVCSIFDVKIDMTPNQLYSLSKTTIDYLESLDKKIDFYLLIEMDEVRADDDMLAFTNMIDQYREYDCINFMDIDVNENPDIIEELNPEGYLNLSEGDMVVKCGENIKKVEARSMYRYKQTSDSNGNTYVDEAYFEGENLITGAIKTVVEGKMPAVYFLTGHGEKNLDENYTRLKANLRNYNYEAKELNLTTEPEVPEDAAIIISAAPKTDFTSAETEKLGRFMDKGGNLSLLMSPNSDNIVYANIESIMHEYGLGMDYNRVYESDSSKHVSGDKYEIMVNLVDLSEVSDESATADLTDLTSPVIEAFPDIQAYMPASRSFYQYQSENAGTLNICPLIETNNTAYGENCGGTGKDMENSGILYLAAYSEDPTRNNSKLVVMGNAEFIDDENLPENYVIIPVYLYTSTITWMYNSDIDMGIPSRERTYDYMNLESESDANMILVLFIAAPVVVAASGTLIWLKRRHA
ncbi:MAG: Gldg family protein [Porcipelethomonas sp.]